MAFPLSFPEDRIIPVQKRLLLQGRQRLGEEEEKESRTGGKEGDGKKVDSSYQRRVLNPGLLGEGKTDCLNYPPPAPFLFCFEK